MEGQNEKGHNQGVKYAIEDMEKWLELFQDVEPSQRKSSVLEVAASIRRIAELLGEKSLVEVASKMKTIDDLDRKMTIFNHIAKTKQRQSDIVTLVDIFNNIAKNQTTPK